ncbi:Hypothetical protein PHPALM_10452 [Phytophthora palmivora]|uniref:Reverse transcriptase n=1 Tax=Phytophthora palmivora TaxID=4796 RepID=A0A2P4Y4P3_9STRA|nr:Hypothetical protein PHPALM_10452 [Phytophthora palmivora]
MWLSGDRVPRTPGYVSVGSRRYAEWQNLAYQATTDEISEVDIDEQIPEPAVERPEYITPTAILPRPAKAIQNVEIAGDGDASPSSSKCTSDQGQIDPDNSDNLRTKVAADISDPTMDDEVCIKEGGSLFAEDVEDQMAVLPEVTATTEEVKIEDLQIDDANTNTRKEIERLEQIIWKRKHLYIGKGNALPPGSDVGNAKPVAQRCRKVAIQFREKLYQLIKGLLSARMIRHSTSPWASPIVVIIKKNGIDIRLCIDYRLRLLDNALYGFVKVTQDQDRSDRKDVFETGEPDLERNESVLGRRSYIDDILVTGRSWGALCGKVEKLLDACDGWNLSISVTKSFWGQQKVDYLGHRVSAEDFAIYASVLYELREADFYEIARRTKSTGDDEDVATEEGNKWTEARTAFATLKNKIVNAPILQHFDVDRQPVVVVYASKSVGSAQDTRHLLYSTRDKVDQSIDASLYTSVATSLSRVARTVRTMGCTSIKLDP